MSFLSGFLAGKALLIGLELAAESRLSGCFAPCFEGEVVVVLTFEEIIGHRSGKFFSKLVLFGEKTKGKCFFVDRMW